jgi:hypothetical protein
VAPSGTEHAEYLRVEAGLAKPRRFWRGVSIIGAAILASGVVVGMDSEGAAVGATVSAYLDLGGRCIWIGDESAVEQLRGGRTSG